MRINRYESRRSMELFIYHIGKFLWIPVVLAGLWFAGMGGYEAHSELFTCVIRQKTGMICPGCGGTRALYSLCRGEIFQSIRFHPAVAYMALAYLHYMIRCFYRRYKNRKIDTTMHIERYLYILVVVILIQWLAKIAFAVIRIAG